MVAALGSSNTIDNNIEPSDHYDFSYGLKYQTFISVVIRRKEVTYTKNSFKLKTRNLYCLF